MDPMPGALDALDRLWPDFDIYLLSTAPWDNPSAWADKRRWVEQHLGERGRKRLILTHRKDLAIGDYLVDDRTRHGAGDFRGRHIHFGQGEFPDWPAVVRFLEDEARSRAA
jgi:5'(3')-deoxyribonucleotidase